MTTSKSVRHLIHETDLLTSEHPATAFQGGQMRGQEPSPRLRQSGVGKLRPQLGRPAAQHRQIRPGSLSTWRRSARSPV